MKIKSLLILSVLTVGSLGAQVVVTKGKANLAKLTPGVDTTVISTCPGKLDNALAKAASYLRMHYKASGTWVAWIGDKLDVGPQVTRNFRNMKAFIATGDSQNNKDIDYLSFQTGLQDAKYKENMNKQCIYIPATNERVTPKAYLEAVLSDLK